MHDEQIREDIRKARGGDTDALSRLLAHHHEQLTRAARQRLGPGLRGRIRISDLVQSTCLEVVKAIKTFDGDSERAFAGWLERILVNNIRDKGRYFAARKRATSDQGREDADQEGPADHRFPSPSTFAILGEDVILVDRALERLPADYRRALIMDLREHRNLCEIAAALERTEGATRVLLSRARSELLIAVRRLGLKPRGG